MFALFIGFRVGSHGRSYGSPYSLGFTLALLKVTKFIRVRVGLLGRARDRRVLSGSRGFIRVRRVNSV